MAASHTISDMLDTPCCNSVAEIGTLLTMKTRRGVTAEGKQVLITYLEELSKHFTNGFAFINLDFADSVVAANLPKDAHHVMDWVVKNLDWQNSVRRFTLYSIASYCKITQPRVSLMLKALEEISLIYRPSGTRGIIHVNPELIYRGKLSNYQDTLDDWHKMKRDALDEQLNTCLVQAELPSAPLP